MAAQDEKLWELMDEAYDHLGTGRLEEARKAHEAAVRLDPDHREVALLEVELLKAEDLGEEAVAACEQARERFPEDVLVAYTLATLLLDIYDDVAEARPLLEEVVQRLQKGEQPDLGEADDEERAAEATQAFLLDALLTLSDCRGADRDPRGALEAAEAAVALDKEDAAARVCLAAALFDLGRIDEAEKAVARALDLDPRFADAFWLRGRIATLRNDDAAADRAFEKACVIDPGRFTAPVRMTEDQFAEAMQEALEELPDRVQDYLKNVAIAVESLPPMERLAESDPPLSPGLLGLYEGTPPSLAQGEDPWAHHPRHITLFRKNIEIAAQDEADLRELIATTLWHEIGHYLGLDEEDLEERGLG